MAGAATALACTAAAQPAPAGYADTPGGKLWYETCGSSPQTLVLIHEGGLHSVTWDDVWPMLCKSFRLIRYDRRGWGRSPAAKAPYVNVDDLQAVMQAARASHAVLVGSSYGAGIAVDFALAHPDQVDRLVLLGPELTDLAHSKLYLDGQTEVARLRSQGHLLDAIKKQQLFSPNDDADAARLVKLETASPEDFQHADPVIPPKPARPRLAEIKAPTLIVVGEYDVADYQAEAGKLEYAVRDSRRVLVANAGHLVQIERPAEFTALVARFIQGVPSPGAEEALRRVIDQLSRGAPEYGRMGPGLAALVRANLDVVKGALTAFGPIKSVAFQKEESDGADVFTVVFDKRSTEWRIELGENGRIDTLLMTPPN